jgi:hypothetical protein
LSLRASTITFWFNTKCRHHHHLIKKYNMFTPYIYSSKLFAWCLNNSHALARCTHDLNLHITLTFLNTTITPFYELFTSISCIIYLYLVFGTITVPHLATYIFMEYSYCPDQFNLLVKH